MRLRIEVTAIILATLCSPAPGGEVGCASSKPVDDTDLQSPAIGRISEHFGHWLDENGYASYDFSREDLPGGSFGGKGSGDDPVSRQPVVFVHGNSDRAAGQNGIPAGWTAVIGYFLGQGYTPAELYATTWGPADPDRAGEQTHSFANVSRIRAFVRAVLAYTGADKLDLISHSMGVTLARKAIQGGKLEGRDLGPPLTDRVDTFVGIAGANQGLTACFWARSVPTCSAKNGFYPGYLTFFGLTGVSDFLADLNARPGLDGDYVYSIWSRADQVIGFGDLVYGQYTSRIPGQDGEKVYSGYPYGHFCVRDLSAPVQLEMITNHRVP